MTPRAPASSVYRTPGRSTETPRIPRPSWRTLLGPLGHTAAYVTLAVVAVVLFNAVAPAVFGTSSDVRLIPSVDSLEDALFFTLPLSLVALIVLVVRRVRPSWGGMGLQSKIPYVVGLLVAQSIVVLAGAAAIWTSRGGLHLFEPTHLTSRWLPDGRTAHVYTVGGLRCGYDVFVSGPLALTASKTSAISRSTCLEPTPHVQLNPDGSVVLVDAANKPLESQPSPSFSLFFGGC